MKKIKFLNGMSALFAFAAVALATTFTSCEKEEFNVNVTPTDAQATISPIVLAIQDGVTTDVTGVATITPTELSFTGNPDLAAKNVDVTAEYKGLSTKVTVKIPALKAGQFAILTPTIILQEANAETEIVIDEKVLEPETDPTKIVWDNTELFWYNLKNITYLSKTGAKELEGSRVISNTASLVERTFIESFFNTLGRTYDAKEVTLKGDYKVYANSRTSLSVTYMIAPTEFKVVKTVTKADAPVLGSVTIDNYSTTIGTVIENQDIPGHGHSHGHGHGHGGDNSGGGIVLPD